MRRAALGSALAAAIFVGLGGCSLLLGEGLTSPDEPTANDASGAADGADGTTSVSDAGIDSPTRDAVVPPDGACPATLNDKTLAAWYPFEEDDPKTIHDCSGHGLAGTLVPDGSFLRVAGRTSGKAIDTAGDHGCFDLGSAAALAFVGSAFTVSAWIKPRRFSYPDPVGGADPKPRWFLDRFASAGGGWGIGTDDTAFDGGFVEAKSFRAGGGFDEVESPAPIAKDVWVHVAGVFSPTAIAVYVDGTLAAQKLLPTPTPVDPQAHGWLGCREGDEPSFDGLLDDVRIYARALSASEIAALSK